MKFLLKILILYFFNYSLYSEYIEDIIGNISYYTIRENETLIDIARRNNLAFPEIMLNNPQIKDPWVLEVDKTIKLPTRHILPSGKRQGIIINKGDLRVYFFKDKNNIFSFPIGIGRSDWETPTGKAVVVGKKKNPYWTVPESILEEEPHWPKVVKPGPDNPLGTRAIYLSIPGYLMHGTNKPWGVGMRVSHGCIRMYPEGIEELYDYVEKGEKVQIIEQNVKAGWQGGVLFLEVHTMPDYGLEENEKKRSNIGLLPEAAKVIQQKAGIHIAKIDWKRVTKAVKMASGVPEAILSIY